jgi:streptogramin lyase/predicted Ser/Thr protein kinase
MATDSRIGSTIAGYRIERLLGHGGMGRVYLAEDTRLGRKVALKLLDPELADDQRFRDRFTRESRLAASLDHPNVVPIYEAGEADEVLFIAMRYVEGTDLGRLIEAEGPLPPDRAAAIVSQVASALDAAHRRGLVHRDVKPGNVLVGEDDHAYLTDFGLIKRREADTGLTKSGQFMGSVDYAAPEQIMGQDVDGRADVYSLGCVLYECLTGDPPYPQDSEVAVLYAHLKDPFPSVTAKRPDLPPALDAVVAKAMAKRPEDRFATAGELAAAARAELGSGTGERAVLPGRVGSGISRRRRWALAAIGGVVAVAAAVAVTLATYSGHGRQTNSPTIGSPTQPSPTIRFGVALVGVDPKTGKVLVQVPGTGGPAVGEGALWALHRTGVARVDPKTGAVKLIGLSFVVRDLALGQGAVWVEGGNGQAYGSQVARIDPATDKVDRVISVRSSITLSSIATSPGAVWVSDQNGTLTLIDPGTNRIVSQVKRLGSADQLVYGEGSLWVLDRLDGLVAQVDPDTGKILQKIPISGDVKVFTVAFGSLWVADSFGGTVTKIDPTTRTGHDVRVGLNPLGIAAGFGAIWVTNEGDGTLTRIDPVTLDTTEFALGAPVVSVAPDRPDRRLWVGVASQCEGC